MSCFCPITTLIEPSIIPSTYNFSLEEARHKMLYMEPEDRALSCSRDSLTFQQKHYKKEDIKKGWSWVFPLWLRGLNTRLVCMRMQVRSPALISRSRILRCRKLWCGSKTHHIWCRVGGSCSSHSTPSLGTSICQCGPGGKKKGDVSGK